MDRELLETMVDQQGERFSARLNELGIRHSWFPRTSGLHNRTSRERELGAWLKTLERNRNYGSSDRHRDGRPECHGVGGLFDIHGWRVEISRRRAQIVRSVSDAGFLLTGAGSFRVRIPGLFEPGHQYDVSVVDPTGENDYQQRADKKGRLTFTGRLTAAMHDPIIPGKRTQYFSTLGQDEITTVRITSAPESADPTPSTQSLRTGTSRESATNKSPTAQC